MPILPISLVNGVHCIAYNCQIKIPSFNPVDLIEYFIAKLEGKNYEFNLKPWY